ncbi:MAG: AMP-binding protein [Ilumatobacter sp.]
MTMTSTSPTINFQSPHPSLEFPETTLHELIRERARSFGDAPALIDGSSGHTVGYADLDRQIGSVAAGLAADGVRQGDVIAMMSPNCVEFPAAVLGAMAAGAVPTLVNPTYSGAELSHQLRDSGATRVIVFVMFLPAVQAVAEECGIEEIYVIYGGADDDGTPFQELLDHEPTPVDVAVSPDDLAVLPYSSGTTGRSKGVALTHRHVVAQLFQAGEIMPLQQHDRVLAFLPMFHIMGFSIVALNTLATGLPLITVPTFEPVSFLETLQREKISALILVPPVANFLVQHPMVDGYDLRSLRVIGCGAAPLGHDTEVRLADRFECMVGQGWGMTETSGAGTIATFTEEAESRPGSSGQLVPNCEAVIIDPDTGTSLGPNETGELWVRGPNVFSEYHRNPEASAATVDADGWLHTGDLCHFDDDGFLFVTDRLKELIKVKGFQVAPAELEALLLGHPAVMDAAVIGRPDERSGEVPVAFVVPHGEQLDTEEVAAWIAGQVTDYKRLAEVIVVDAIPKNPSGKILRRVLRDQFAS